MRLRAPATLTFLIASLLAMTGCATATDTTGTTTAPTVSDGRSPTPDPTTAPGDGASADSSPTPSAPAPGAYVDYSDGLIEATTGTKALFFHASWCPQCRALDEALRAEGVPDGLTVFKVDYDSRTDLRQKYGVTLQTTIVFVDDAGEAISSTVLYDDPSVDSLVAAIP